MSIPASNAHDGTMIGADESTPIFVATGTEDLLGMFTRPAGSSNGVAVLILAGGGSDPTFGKNQVRRRLALELAGRGFHVLRINYRGVAESGGTMREIDFENPWTEDAVASVRWLESQGFRQIAIIGQCFGGRTALAAAEKVAGLVGLALVAPPVRDVTHGEAILRRPLSWYLKQGASLRSPGRLVGSGAAQRRRKTIKAKLLRIFRDAGKRPQVGASLVFLEALQGVLDARTPVLFLYGSSDDFYPDFDFVRAGPMARMIERSGDLVTMQVVDARFGGMHSVSTQEIFVSTLVSWIDALVPADREVATDRR
jgi:alpha/beta superfamily hydrolase